MIDEKKFLLCGQKNTRGKVKASNSLPGAPCRQLHRLCLGSQNKQTHYLAREEDSYLLSSTNPM
jgi:hypothetical protein